ncbi:MAG: phosphoribosyl-AMP cyclohydrolase [Anaerolineales bacterium]|nr:phosphoribosyl-AMP cyclohydrolase [Anaerolineales bacterium]
MSIELKFDEKGLLTCVAQNAETGQVLMVAMMNEEAYQKTLETKQAYFWSRSRQQLWKKGETSGNFLDVKEVRVDCDGDAVLLMVNPRGPACHTGEISCFFRKENFNVI